LLYQSLFWRRNIFTLVINSLILFLVLTSVAMLFYAGGTITDATTSGYSFFHNFFSELGLTKTHAGQPNTISAVLFVTALTLAGAGVIGFFIAFPQFFMQSSAEKWLSGMGSLSGIMTGIGFIGVAVTPVDLHQEIHLFFVFWAFRTFPLAVFCYAIAILLGRQYPKRFALVFIAFGILLTLYLLFLEKGPDIHTPEGMIIQAVGQKIIVYASIISLLIQAFGAKKVARESVA
jgi:hypothetical protein